MEKVQTGRMGWHQGALAALEAGGLGERGDALAGFCRFGPAYRRAVADDVAEAGYLAVCDRWAGVEKFLLRAELHAGFRSYDETRIALAHLDGQLFEACRVVAS